MNKLEENIFGYHKGLTKNMISETKLLLAIYSKPAWGTRLRLYLFLAALLLSSGGASAREGTEWMTSYWYNANDTKRPRVLLVGDSICNGYQTFVRDELAGTANVSFYATSKCASDPTYLKSLAFMLEEYDYQVVHLNNGLHSLSTDRKAWESGLVAALNLIKEKGRGAKIIWATSTPLKDPDLSAKAKELNLIADKLMQANSIPVDDLFALMDPLDRNVYWVDTYHYREDARKMQAKQVADHVRAALGVKQVSTFEAHAALAAAASETGPNGKITTTIAVPDALANLGFEGAGGWSIYPPAPAKGSMEFTTENPHSGAKAAKITVNSLGVQLYQHKPKLEAGATYTLKYWARAASPSSVNVFLRTTKPPYQFFGKNTGKLGAAWQEYQTAFTLPADFNPADHTLFIDFLAPGTYWFDDISFSKP